VSELAVQRVTRLMAKYLGTTDRKIRAAAWAGLFTRKQRSRGEPSACADTQTGPDRGRSLRLIRLWRKSALSSLRE
jgi:hypothetical protein